MGMHAGGQKRRKRRTASSPPPLPPLLPSLLSLLLLSSDTSYLCCLTHLPDLVTWVGGILVVVVMHSHSLHASHLPGTPCHHATLPAPCLPCMLSTFTCCTLSTCFCTLHSHLQFSPQNDNPMLPIFFFLPHLSTFSLLFAFFFPPLPLLSLPDGNDMPLSSHPSL